MDNTKIYKYKHSKSSKKPAESNKTLSGQSFCSLKRVVLTAVIVSQVVSIEE